MADRLTLTIEETADLLGVGRSTCYDAARRGEIPTLKLGRRLLVPRHALEQLLATGSGREGDLRPAVLPGTVNDWSEDGDGYGERSSRYRRDGMAR
jgi:excisionase family DNA binding protein